MVRLNHLMLVILLIKVFQPELYRRMKKAPKGGGW